MKKTQKKPQSSKEEPVFTGRQFRNIIYPVFLKFLQYLLPSQFIEILTAYIVEQQSVEEIAKKFEITENRVKTYITLGKRKLIRFSLEVGKWAETLSSSQYNGILPGEILLKLEEAERQVFRLTDKFNDLVARLPADVLNKVYSKESDKKEDPFLDTALGNIDMPLRLFKLLNANKIKSIREVLEFSEKDLLVLRNFGQKHVQQLQNLLKEKGFSLKAN